MGVTGRILPPNTDFEHARVWFTWFHVIPRDLTYDRHTDNIHIYITRNLDWTPQCGARFARPIMGNYWLWPTFRMTVQFSKLGAWVTLPLLSYAHTYKACLHYTLVLKPSWLEPVPRVWKQFNNWKCYLKPLFAYLLGCFTGTSSR